MALTLALASLDVQPALAQSATDSATAEVLFNEALALLQGGNPAEACMKLEESQRLDPGVGTLLYLADCYQQMGRTASAWATFREAAYMAKDRSDEREQVALDYARELEPKLSYLTLQVTATPGVALEVRHDGKLVGQPVWGTAFPVDPGSHTVEASAPGKKPWSTTINVADGPRKESVVIPELEDAPPEPTAPPVAFEAPKPVVEASWQTTAGWVLVGTGSAAVVASGVLALLARGDDADAAEHCRPDRNTLCDSRGVDLGESAKTKATFAGISAGVGLAALGAGVTLLLTAPSEQAEVALQARTRPDGGELWLEATW